MNQNKIDSFYELIKQKFLEKGRSLKVISDWDKCLQSPKSFILWELSPKNLTSSEYFSKFWSKAKFTYYDHGFGTREHFGAANRHGTCPRRMIFIRDKCCVTCDAILRGKKTRPCWY